MLEITGRVVIEGTGLPVRAVVVEAFDVKDGDLRDDDALLKSPSLGSATTDGDGAFRIAVAGDEKRTRRVSLAVVSPGASNGRPAVLHSTRPPRALTAGVAEFVVTLSTDAVLAGAVKRTTAAAGLAAGVAAIRTAALDDTSTRRDGTRDVIEKALFEQAIRHTRRPDGSLPGAVVRPGQSVAARVRDLVRDLLGGVAARARVTAYVDVPDKDAALVDGTGAPVGTLRDADIERFLFGDDHERGTPFRYLRDVVAAACRAPGLSFSAPASSSGSSAPASASAGGGASTPASPTAATRTQVEELLSALLDATVDLSAEPAVAMRRATAEQINAQLNGLMIAAGPADVAAQFDIDRLFLAFDPLVRHHPDPGLIDDLVVAAEAVRSLGGDIDRRVKAGENFVDAVLAEAKVVVSAAPVAASEGGPPRALAFSFLNPLDAAGDAFGDLAGAGAGALSDLVGGSGSGSGGSGGGASGWPFGGSPPFDVAAPARDRFAELRGLLARLQRVRRSDYGFTAYATDDEGASINIGLVLTYRQRWEPRGYQAGELVKTIPVPPKSTIKYSSKRKTTKTYADKRVEASETVYSQETTDTERDIARLVRNAKTSTAFSLSHETGASIPGAGSTSTTSTWTTNAERASESTKETFREAVRKQAEQLRRSSTVEITTGTSDELELEESSEITNPNDELVCTYLFYELQRRFSVAEQLQRVAPVILVAQPLPAPSDIDDVWITRYDWILRRVLLDPSFLPALDYVSSGKLAADHGRVRELEDNLDRQVRLVERLKKQLATLRSADLLPDPRNWIEQWKVRLYDQRYRDPSWREDPDKVREVFGEDVANRLEKRRESEEQVEGELKREIAQLEKATSSFNAAFETYAVEAVQRERLLIHVKDNVIYYQQAIWDHEVPDQRFLRLKDVAVPRITGWLTYAPQASGRPPRAPTWRPPLRVDVSAALRLAQDNVSLDDIADLANPLGYLGNAIIFPLKRWNPLATFLMSGFSSAVTGVSDPDDRGNFTIPELERLVSCLVARLSAQQLQDLRPAIEEAYQARLNDPRPDSQDVVLPTGSLYIDALPGTHPLLEDFKLLHRAYDVANVANDVVGKRLEQLRLAARLVDGQYADPDTEKVIIRDVRDGGAGAGGTPIVVDT